MGDFGQGVPDFARDIGDDEPLRRLDGAIEEIIYRSSDLSSADKIVDSHGPARTWKIPD
jgi:hypothetical protein